MNGHIIKTVVQSISKLILNSEIPIFNHNLVITCNIKLGHYIEYIYHNTLFIALFQRQSNKNLAIINFLVFVLDDAFLDAYFKISKYRQSK